VAAADGDLVSGGICWLQMRTGWTGIQLTAVLPADSRAWNLSTHKGDGLLSALSIDTLLFDCKATVKEMGDVRLKIRKKSLILCSLIMFTMYTSN